MFARHKSKGRWARALLAGTKPNKRKRAMSVEEFESRRMYAVFTVTSDQDTNSAGELRAAVALANVNPGPDTIDFASSVSSIQLMLGELQITGDTLLEGATPAGTAVSIMASPNSRIFRVDDANPLTSRHVVMHSLRLKGGDVTASLSDAGGAVLNNEDLTLSAVAVNSNRAHFGGGVANFSRLVVIDSAFDANDARAGGALLTSGLGSTLIIRHSEIHGNQANVGGGLAADQSSIEVIDSAFRLNSAQNNGGGMHLVNGARAEIVDTEINQNQAGQPLGVPGQGGGLFADNGARVTLLRSRVTMNGNSPLGNSVVRGGGILAGDGVGLTINSSVISGNIAFDGGGIATVSTNDAVFRTKIDIADSNIETNRAMNSGGGLDIGPNVDLSLKCTTISGNIAHDAGGGLRLRGDSNPLHIVATIQDSVVSANEAGQRGGGLFSVQGVQLDVNNSIISENSSNGHGGGLFLAGRDGIVQGINSTSIRQSLISDNSATNPGAGPAILRSGGGIWVGSDARLDIGATTIERNRAYTDGGGIAADESASLLVQNSTISGNVASLNGGGASVQSSDATFLQTTFYGNKAGQNGGGLHVVSALPNTVHVRHSTLSHNMVGASGVGTGGGIFVRGPLASPLSVSLDHTIVSGNQNQAALINDEVFDGGLAAGALLVSARFSLLRDNAGTGFAAGNPDIHGNLIGTPGAPIDANLRPLGSAGGPTSTLVPFATSPVVNAGDPVFIGPPVGDQRLLPYQRVAFGRIDIGAVELQPPPPDPDFDNDGVANCSDINHLVAAIVSGLNPPAFDLTGDGSVDNRDLDKWLDDAPTINGLAIQRYLRGDANLDTVVDGVDFGIWNANKFTHTNAWCKGDFNADGVTDGADFGIWNANKFQSSPPLSNCGLFQDNRLRSSKSDEEASLIEVVQPSHQDRPVTATARRRQDGSNTSSQHDSVLAIQSLQANVSEQTLAKRRRGQGLLQGGSQRRDHSPATVHDAVWGLLGTE